jgi:anthranilate phosphoribosyltransferase
MNTVPWADRGACVAAGARRRDGSALRALMAAWLDGGADVHDQHRLAKTLEDRRTPADAVAAALVAAPAQCRALTLAGPVAMLPSYGGGEAGPSLTPLLALRVAHEGARVPVHGPREVAGRVGSAQILPDLGLAIARGAADVAASWARCEPAFVPLDVLCPPLAASIAAPGDPDARAIARWAATLLGPVRPGPAVRVLGSAGGSQDAQPPRPGIALVTGAPWMLVRGVDGEPVVDARRLPTIDAWIGGRGRADLSCAGGDSRPGDWPLLPSRPDAAATAMYIQAVASGARPSPAALEYQVALLLAALRAVDARPR